MARDFAAFLTTPAPGQHALDLAVDGLQCGACVWLIESVLAAQSDVVRGRVNMTTRLLSLVWTGPSDRAAELVAAVECLGYRLVPYDAAALASVQDATLRRLLRALAVAGFAAMNVMMLSIAVWAGLWQDMGPTTRTLLHWVSALVAMPTVAYAGMPFFRSAASALRAGRTNMDVPISIGVLLVTALSLVQTMQGGDHAYFDSAVSLLFFLLIGRVLDHWARGQARATAQHLLALRARAVALVQPDGTLRPAMPETVPVGARVLVGMGERIGVDGIIIAGETTLDAGLVTGESLPMAAGVGAQVFAGTLNLGAAITLRVTATGANTLLAECARLIAAAEERRGRFVVLADRVARRYAPTVHLAAALTFLWWWGVQGVSVGAALLTACAVLIITCPCALALAVPAVQVLATGRLLQRGILVKSPTALERLATVDLVVFDKTGTLTHPGLVLLRVPGDEAALQEAAAMAASSRHPLSRAIVAAAGGAVARDDVLEVAGLGLRCAVPDGELRLGRRDFAGDIDAPPATGPEIWLHRPGQSPALFSFQEALRDDAATTINGLRRLGVEIALLSGDQPGPVARVAKALGITNSVSAASPVDKVACIEAWRAGGRRVLMVGDGLNDGPSLAAADVSVSPSSAADVSQTVADVVMQGEYLAPVLAVLRMARRARVVTAQNIALSIGYNVIMVPLAVAGFVTPWLAALAMSASSLLVIGNSFRVRRVVP